MSIIIKGMEAPKKCGECKISFRNQYYSINPPLCCSLISELPASLSQRNPVEVDQDNRHSDCPIEEYTGGDEIE